VREYFTSKVECDVKLINERLKNANANVVYLVQLLQEVETLAPKSAILDSVERKEKNRKETYVGTYTTISAIEQMIDRIKKKLIGILKVAKTQSYKPKTQFNIENGSGGYTVTTPKECDGTPLKDELRMIRAKLEEIEYQVDTYLPYMESLAKFKDETKKEQQEAIADISQKANAEMSGLLGVPVDLKLDKQMNKKMNREGFESMEEPEMDGVEPTDEEKKKQEAEYDSMKGGVSVNQIKKINSSKQRATASKASSSHMGAYGSRAASQGTAQNSMKKGTSKMTKKLDGDDAVLNNKNGSGEYGDIPPIKK